MMFLTLILLAASQGTNAQHNPPLQLNPVNPQDNLANSVPSRFNDFDIKLLTKFDANRNYFISPASIKATLGMVLEGARGSCAEEIAGVLGLPVNAANSRDKLQRLIGDLTAKSTTTLLEVANGAFISNAFQVVPEYKRNLKQYYDANVESVDFGNNEAAARRINNWVKDVTRGYITDIITPANFNSEATLVIANALYFKGKWKHEFDGTTSIKCFRSSKNNCVPTKMMQVTNNFNFKYLSDFDAQAIELPYGDGQYAMLVLLPSEKNNVRLLTEDLRRRSFAHIVQSLEPIEVNVNLPKFEIDYTADMVSDLQSLGIEQIFDQKANLSGIIARGEIKIDNIVHKAKIEVNEKGTVAAAATGVIVIPLMGSSTPHFDANRPFLFFIYHVASKNIIFEGRLNEPENTYDEIFEGPPQTSKPLPPPPATQTQNIQRQQPATLSFDGTPPRQAFVQVQPSHDPNLFYPSDTVVRGRTDESFNAAQNRQRNAGSYNQGRK